jgi:hypothetical protein
VFSQTVWRRRTRSLLILRRGVTLMRRAAQLHGELLDRMAGVTLHPHVCCVAPFH